MSDSEKTEATIQKLVAGIDEMLALQLNTIIQHPDFKALESLWRGVYFMVANIPSGQAAKSVRVRLLDMSWNELSDDLNLSANIQSSILYRLIYQQELNTLGGDPFGLLLVDRSVSVELDPLNPHDDLYTLQLLSELGQEALCPVIMPLAPDFLGTDDANVWSDIYRVSRILGSDDFMGWQRLRTLPSSRFLGLTLPQILLRPPWQGYTRNIVFNEYAVYGMGSDCLWGNSAFAFASNIIQEFLRIRWFGFLRIAGSSGGAVVKLVEGQVCAAKLKITDRLEEFYCEQGMIPLMTCYLDQQLAFFNNCSVYKTPVDDDEMRLTNMLQTTLMGCRFGHYLKQLIREYIGSYDSAVSCQRNLNNWLQSYTSNVDYADDTVLARYPLKKASVSVWGQEDMGIYHCEVQLQPQYQFDVMNTSIVLKTNASELAGQS